MALGIHMNNPDVVSKLEVECQVLFSKLSSLQREIKDKLSIHADGKNLKGNELVGWLGEIYGKLLFNGKLVDDREEYDFVSATGHRVSVKTRKGWNSGWKQSSAIPKIEIDGCPTHLLFVHLNDDYSIDRMWLFEWLQLVITERFKRHIVRGAQRSFIFTIDEVRDEKFIVYRNKRQPIAQVQDQKVYPLIKIERTIMNEQELTRKLNSVGKTIFIEYFSAFKAYSEGRLSKDKCIELLVEKKVSNEAGASIRCGNAKRIFESKKECDALIIVSESTRLSSYLVDVAKKLIIEHCR